MKCGFCRLLLDTSPTEYGEVQLVAPNGNGIVARLCKQCLLEMGKFLDVLVKGGFAALEDAAAENEPAPLFVPPSIWRQN